MKTAALSKKKSPEKNTGSWEEIFWNSWFFRFVFPELWLSRQVGNKQFWSFRGVGGFSGHERSEKWDDFRNECLGFSSSPGGVTHSLSIYLKGMYLRRNLLRKKTPTLFLELEAEGVVGKHFFNKNFTWKLWISKCAVLFARRICVRNHPEDVFDAPTKVAYLRNWGLR